MLRIRSGAKVCGWRTLYFWKYISFLHQAEQNC